MPRDQVFTPNSNIGGSQADEKEEAVLVKRPLLDVVRYRCKDMSVFPLKRGEKTPIEDWAQFQKVLPNPVRLDQWAEEYPDCNWGIVTGEISGLVVLDIDSEEAEEEARRYGIPRTPTVKTPRGRHFYFKHPGYEVRLAVGLRPGMDFRGDGGYIVAPPSRLADGREYKWEISLDDAELADLPKWIIDLIRKNGRAVEPSQGGVPDDPPRYSSKALEDVLQELASAPEGTRNDQLNIAAYSMGQLIATGSIGQDEVETQLRTTALASGLADSEVDATIESGISRGFDDPRWGPEEPGRQAETRFRLLSYLDLLDLPDPDWLIDEILPQGALAVLYGDAGSGKSFTGLDWAASIARGRWWLGREVKSDPTIYVCGEGVTGFKKRVVAWAENHGKLDAQPLRILPEPVDLSSKKEVDHLIKAIRETSLGDPALVVVDTLARCFGDGDENSATDMQKFITGADLIRRAFSGCTVLVIHHTGKDKTRGGRGSSALSGAADTTLRLNKSKGTITLSCEKQKDAEPFEDIKFELKPVPVGSDETSCILVAATTQASQGFEDDAGPRFRSDNDQKAFEVLASLNGEGASWREWRAVSLKAGVKEGTFKNCLSRLLEDELVLKTDDRYHVAGSTS